MLRRFFFFPHQLEKAEPAKLPDAPWRVPYEVAGMLVTTTAAASARGVVMGDGFRAAGSVIVGGNQDPCIFSTPLGGVHSFCRVTTRKGNDHDVRELTRPPAALLPTIVETGDVVFYGKPDPDRGFIAVDTVLVVAKKLPFRDLIARVGTGCDAYVYNLSDARPGGSHEGEDQQVVFVGSSNPTPESVHTLATSFVPLAARDYNGHWQVLRVERSDVATGWSDLMSVARTMFSGPGPMANKGYICELPAGAGEALARAVMTRSKNTRVNGAVFVPPLRPCSPPRRLGNDGKVRSPDEHMKRLAPR